MSVPTSAKMCAYIISIGNYVITSIVGGCSNEINSEKFILSVADIPQKALIVLEWKRQPFTTTTAYPGQRKR